MARIETLDGTVANVKVGDWVGFKADVEQYGMVTKIEGQMLTLENTSGFEGYIAGETVTRMHGSAIWVD